MSTINFYGLTALDENRFHWQIPNAYDAKLYSGLTINSFTYPFGLAVFSGLTNFDARFLLLGNDFVTGSYGRLISGTITAIYWDLSEPLANNFSAPYFTATGLNLSASEVYNTMWSPYYKEDDQALWEKVFSGNDSIALRFGGGVNGYAGNDVIAGSERSDTLMGGDGNDTLLGGSGDDVLDGGAGVDTATYSLGLTDYLISFSSDVFTVLALSGSEGVDQISNVEFLQFSDQTIATTSLDFTAPVASNFSPINGATDIAVGSNFILTFDEAIKVGTGNFVVSTSGRTIASISVTDSSQVSISGSTVTINPSTDLSPGIAYSVTAASGVIRDLANNNWAGTGASPYGFTTAEDSMLSLPGAFATWQGTSGNTYGLYKTGKTWSEAKDFAANLGGYLIKVDSISESQELSTKLQSLLDFSDLANSSAPDGGGAAYVWLGASDAATEGSWKWVKDGSSLSISRTEWGEGALGSEPDNYNNQDYLALGLENWPYGFSDEQGYGDVGEWNDLQGSNVLYFVVEKESSGESSNQAPTGAVTIKGTAKQGQKLTAANTLKDADGLGTITYQWKADGTSITGATGTSLTLTQSQVGKTISVTASYVDRLGNDESVSSNSTTSVANLNDLPTGTVTITGTAAQNQTLTASNTLADLDGLGDITYTWMSGKTVLGTGSTYSLTQSQVGLAITAVASYVDGFSKLESKASAATAKVANVNDTPTVANSIADKSGTEGVAFSFTLPTNVFTDLDKDKLVITASSLPNWLKFAKGKFTGTPTYSASESTYSIVVTANDGKGGTVTDSFDLTVANVATITGTAKADAITAGLGSDVINGLAGNDTVVGGEGDDTIDGGLGNDILTGGAGADSFKFTSALKSNLDRVTDFSRGTDKLLLDDAVFTKLTAGELNANNFASTSETAGALDYLVAKSVGNDTALFYDADGSGKGAAIQFATLVGVTDLAASDFLII